MSPLNKIFNTAIGKFYLIISAFGIILGLVITTLCVDVYDKLTSSVMKSAERSHMVVNKRVSLLNTLSLSDNDFTRTEVEDLKKQPFVTDVGEITASSCRVWAFRDEEPLKFKTDIFFEAIDDRFLDKIPNEWHWREQDDFVPVMINADFLNLYNFAFAKTQNLPQFNVSTVGKVVVLLEAYGNGKNRIFKCRIVDVSDRIPSVIVPKPFLDYINKEFGKPSEDKFSRILLKVNNPSDPKLKEYLDKNGIVANEDILTSGKSKTILAQVLGGEIGLALLIIALASIIVVITFELLISKAQKDITLLKHLGIHSKDLMKYFAQKFHLLFVIQLVISAIICLTVGYFLQKHLLDSGYTDVNLISNYAILTFGVIVSLYYLFFRFRIRGILRG
jgi:hypothetical protein